MRGGGARWGEDDSRFVDLIHFIRAINRRIVVSLGCLWNAARAEPFVEFIQRSEVCGTNVYPDCRAAGFQLAGEQDPL